MKPNDVRDLAERHASTSYVHRTDTTNPAFGFSKADLEAFVREVEEITFDKAADHLEAVGKGTSLELVTLSFAHVVREMKK